MGRGISHRICAGVLLRRRAAILAPAPGRGIEQIECAAARKAQRSRASDSNKHSCLFRSRDRYQIKLNEPVNSSPQALTHAKEVSRWHELNHYSIAPTTRSTIAHDQSLRTQLRSNCEIRVSGCRLFLFVRSLSGPSSISPIILSFISRR